MNKILLIPQTNFPSTSYLRLHILRYFLIYSYQKSVLQHTCVRHVFEAKTSFSAPLCILLFYGENDYVCVMTRGHAYDTLVQAQVLQTEACYVGVIGSAAKKAGVCKKLHEMGLTPEDTGRIISPIGLNIKGETPAEIAISIASQMILYRALRKSPQRM